MKYEFLPCPFCKGEDLWVHENDDIVCLVECNGDGCEATGPKVFSWEARGIDARLQLAVDKWNERR